MKTVTIAFLVVIGLGCMSCRQQDVRTVTLTCPQVVGARAADVVVKALSKTDGVKVDSIRVEDGKVTVTYDSMKLAIKNIEFTIAEAGFDAGDIPADTKARDAFRAGTK
jgi:mercuric ion binding protein